MIQRHKRRPEWFESEEAKLLEELRQCRNAVIDSGTHLHPWSRTYQLGAPVIAAIDDLAGELTGDRHFFYIGSSTGPSRT
jgi:hypothetical protein